jgi:hypothetical protein
MAACAPSGQGPIAALQHEIIFPIFFNNLNICRLSLTPMAGEINVRATLGIPKGFVQHR